MEYLLLTTDPDPIQYVEKHFRTLDTIINGGGIVFSCDTDTDSLYRELRNTLPNSEFSLFKLTYKRTIKKEQGTLTRTIDARSTSWG